MTAPADLVVTQLSVEAGEAQESADFITVSRPGGFWPWQRRTDQFCALLAPSRHGQGALCRALLDVMEREFASSSNRSATSALQAVLQAAQQYLRRENGVSLPEDRVTMAAAAVILRGGGAYVGRVGATLAAVRHGGRIERFGDAPAPADGELTGELLGDDYDPAIAYSHSDFGPDDLLVLTSGTQWETVRPDYFDAAMEEGEPSSVASALYELGVWRQTRPTFSILVVEAREPERRGFFQRPPPAEEEEPDFAAGVPPRRPPREAMRGQPGRHAYREDQAHDRGYGATVHERQEDYADGQARWWESGDLLTRARYSWNRMSRQALGPLPQRLLLVAVIAVALAILVILALAIPQIFRPPPDAASALFASAQSLYDQARRAPDAPGARDQLDEARRRAQSSLQMREEPRARALLADVQSDLDRIDRVTRLPSTTPLIDLSPLGPDTSVTRLVVDGTDVYILDVGRARLLRWQLGADGSLQSPEPSVVMQRDAQVGGRNVGALVNMTWVGAGGPRTDPGLIIVESGRTFLTFNPRAPLGRIVPADSMRWNAIAAMTGYQGNVYLVDPDRPAVLEYRPTRNGYESAPFAPLGAGANVNWQAVVDISADATSLFLLQGDGSLRKFARESGQPQTFDGRTPDGLRAPVAVTLVGSGEARTIYVADAGNDRIVEYNPDGSYQRQFRGPVDANQLQGLRDVFVDLNNRLFLLTTRGLYRYDLPE